MISHNKLSPCPKSLNCVCSDDVDRDSHIEPLATGSDSDAAWDALKAVLRGIRGIQIVEESGDRIVATATSRVLRFVDDLVFELRRSNKSIAVRSASRTGYWDLGANRARVESIRGLLNKAIQK